MPISGIGVFEVLHEDGTTHWHWVDDRFTVDTLAAAFPRCLSHRGRIREKAIAGTGIYYWVDAHFTMQRLPPAEEYEEHPVGAAALTGEGDSGEGQLLLFPSAPRDA